MAKITRSKNYATTKSMTEDLEEVYQQVLDGWREKNEQNERVERYWDVYNCVLNQNQTYQGSSQVYMPLIHDAIEARVTRFTNQLFPQSGRNVDVVTSEDPPFELISLLEHYIDLTKLRDLVPPLLRNGDVEGQYSLYISWKNRSRTVSKRVTKPVMVNQVPHPSETYDDMEEEIVSTPGPSVEVISMTDLLVMPATIDHLEDAELVCVARRLTKGQIKDKIDSGEFEEENAQKLLDMFTQTRTDRQQPDTQKMQAEAAGIKVREGIKFALVYQAWKKMKVGKRRRLMEVWFGGQQLVLSARLIPFWNDRYPVLSIPQVKLAGSFWGQSKILPLEQLQYQANDAVNLGLDSAKYSLLPIVMTDPAKNPRFASMVLSMAAVWETNPKDTQFAKFPVLWKDALEIVSSVRSEIMQSLGLNPAMMPIGLHPRKPSQAQVAQEQMVAIESTADALAVLQKGILDPLLQRFFEYDHQFRDDELTVKAFGEMGYKATMIQVPTFAMDTKFQFKWIGVDTFRSAQTVQQQIGFLNVLRSMPPEALGGRAVDAGPLIERAAEQVFGPRLAPKVLKDLREQLSIDPQMENQMIAEGHPVAVSPLDNHKQHLAEHKKGIQNQQMKLHIMAHTIAMQQQAMQATGARPPQAPQGAQRNRSGGGPRAGAKPGAQRPAQGPPGNMTPAQLGPPAMPNSGGGY